MRCNVKVTVSLLYSVLLTCLLVHVLYLLLMGCVGAHILSIQSVLEGVDVQTLQKKNLKTLKTVKMWGK